MNTYFPVLMLVHPFAHASSIHLCNDMVLA
jgi:hypothetical protein